MFIKYCNTKQIQIINDKNMFDKFNKKLASKLIDIDTDNYLYIVNESVHCMEHYGANANGDAFPIDEMRKKYHTFIGSRVSVDHQDNLEIGEVFDSVFLEPIVSGKNVFNGGGYIQNILGINKKLAEERKPGLIDKLVNGDITDTSMGAIVGYTECSIPTCRHIAYNENDYCEHIRGGKNRKIKLADEKEYPVYEICHGVTWFEDSIIVPLHHGGLAGGEGADEQAKVKNIITESVKWEEKVIRLYNILKKTGSKEDIETFESILVIIGGLK